MKLIVFTMQSLKVLVLLGICALVRCQTCTVAQAENPFAGINMKETEAYPETDIQRALDADHKTAQLIIETAKETEIQSKLQIIPSIIDTSSLCKSKFIQIFPLGWTYVNTSQLKCWILKNWWQSSISYVDCPLQICQNLPCLSKGHYCVPTNYKVYTAWSWCGKEGFQYRSFRLPQCCECKRLC